MKTATHLHKNTVEHANFAVLKSPDIPSVLIETGFISNPKEARRLASSSHQRKLARAIFAGTLDYFNQYAVEGTLVYWLNHGDGAEITNVAIAGRSPDIYKIRSGDTLSGIAYRFSVSQSELRRYNKIKGDRIRVGQVLRIPPR